MKYLLSALLFLLLPVLVQGQQNHVPNPSFEDTIQSPQNVGQVTNYVSSWYSYQMSPDYFCRSSPISVGVPFNFAGYQEAIGNSYCGVAIGGSTGTGQHNYYEYLHSHITQLNAGCLYEVSLSVSRGNFSRFAANNLGIYFFDTIAPPAPTTYTMLPVTPQIYYSNYGIITDSQNWVRLSKTFLADSAYDNMVIGGFSINNNHIYQVANTISSINSAYYYVDSVSVITIDSFHIINSDSLLCVGDTFLLPYYVPLKFNNGNVFKVELSDNTGSFAVPITIGSLASDTSGTIVCILPDSLVTGINYKLRIISSTPGFVVDTANYSLKITSPDSVVYNIASNTPVCNGSQVILFVTGAIPLSTCHWTGPSGFSSTLQNPVINGAAPSNSGDYYATLKFYGCEVKDTLPVIVKPLPAKPVANNNSPLCAGDSLHLSSSSSTNGVSYSWAGLGSFASSAQDTSIANSTTAMSGDYIVTADLNGCNRKDTTTVLVKPLPAAVTLSNNTPICAGDTLHLSSTASTTGVSYSWTGPGSFSATAQNTNRANSTAGMTGWYKMLVGLNGCAYTDSTYATVHPIPAVPNINYTNPLCVGEALNLGTTTVSGASYSWRGPGSFSSASQNPTRSNMQFGDTGTYQLTTTVNGCTSDTGRASVHINPLPFVVIFSVPADSICVGDRVNFTALPNNHGGTPAYQWYVNGQALGSGTVFSTTALNDQDVVHCDMTENTKCSTPYTDPSNDITMNVLPWLAPSVSISVSPNRPLKENEYATFTATATNAGNNPQYQWKRNGQDIVGATGSVWSANTLSDNDNISAEIISSYKCPQPPGAVSNGIVVKVLTGVAGLSEVSGLMLYPNPNNGKFVLKGEALTADVLKIEITNAMGQVVHKDDVITENGKLYKEINLQQVSAGLYMLRLSGGDTNCVTRFSVR